MPIQRLSITVHGRVQGVGFRFFTHHCARKYRISGWVRNCADGGVEMEAQGEAEDLAMFREDVREGPILARVHEMVVVELPLVDSEKRFDVRY